MGGAGGKALIYLRRDLGSFPGSGASSLARCPIEHNCKCLPVRDHVLVTAVATWLLVLVGLCEGVGFTSVPVILL